MISKTLGVAFACVDNYASADIHRLVIAHAERTTKKQPATKSAAGCFLLVH